MHNAAFTFVQSVASRVPEGPVLEIGGKNINGTVRALFGESYQSVDIADGPGVDDVADGATFTPAVKPSGVVCCEVLEHTAAAEAICRNAYRILADGGVFIVTAAGEGRVPHSAVDGGALRAWEYYATVSKETLEGWLKPFREVTVTENRAVGDIYAVAVKAAKPKAKA